MAKIFILTKFMAKSGQEKELLNILKEMAIYNKKTTGLISSQITCLSDNPRLFLTSSIFESTEKYEEMKRAFQNDLEMSKKYMALVELLTEKPLNEKYEIIQ